jgi:hypothetical protein
MIAATVLSLVLSASCPATKLIGFDAPLTQDEMTSLVHAQKRCGEIYPDSPCLKSFEKREEQVFWAICGKAE